MRKAIVAFACLVCLTAFATTGSIAAEKKGGGNVVTISTHPRGGWLGVSIQDITPKIKKKKDLKNDEGAYVNEVVDDSPADSAGVKEGDVIVEFNSKKIDEADDLLRAVQKTKPGTKTSIVVLRNNEKKTLDIAVGKNRQATRSRSFSVMPPMAPRVAVFSSSRRWGLDLSELNDQLGEYFGAPNGRGLLVERVEKKSNGEKAGFKAGDVITKVNKNAVEDMKDLSDALEDVEEGAKVEVEVLRKGAGKTITVEADEDDDAPSSYNYNFNYFPHEEMERQFDFQNTPLPDVEGLKMQLRHSLPDMDGLKHQLEILKERMNRVSI